MSELRWNPLYGQWVIIATHRQDRTFFPPDDYCPLCPTKNQEFPTEIPNDTYEIVVFENKFPSLQRNAPIPTVNGNLLEPVRPAIGVCEVVAYTEKHSATLSDLSVGQIKNLVYVLKDRTKELYERPEIMHVFPFENKGNAIGVTLTHPHGQIYAYPFIPPIIEKECLQADIHYQKTRCCLFCDILKQEKQDNKRILIEEDGWVAYIPFFARYPYETHVMPTRCMRTLNDLQADEISGLAKLLKKLLMGFDKLFDLAFPYIMSIHQSPKISTPYHLHIEFYPPMRTKTKLKYLAGSEAGAGTFINDTSAEDKAEELRQKIGSI